MGVMVGLGLIQSATVGKENHGRGRLKDVALEVFERSILELKVGVVLMIPPHEPLLKIAFSNPRIGDIRPAPTANGRHRDLLRSEGHIGQEANLKVTDRLEFGIQNSPLVDRSIETDAGRGGRDSLFEATDEGSGLALLNRLEFAVGCVFLCLCFHGSYFCFMG